MGHQLTRIGDVFAIAVLGGPDHKVRVQASDACGRRLVCDEFVVWFKLWAGEK